MFHYVESIQNTRGDCLIGFFVKAVDPATGSVADIYADESSTPIVTASGVPNAAAVDSDGNVSFYVESGEYHLDIYATDGDTFVKRVERVPMITPGDFVTDGQLADTTGAAMIGTASGGTVEEDLGTLSDTHSEFVDNLADTGGAALVGTSGGGTVQAAVDRIGTFVGYDAGSGGVVTQLTSKSTNVTINKRCGQITTHNASLGAGGAVAFFVNNSTVAATDVITANLQSAAIANYDIRVGQPSAGFFVVVIINNTGGALAEALVINFAVIKAVAS